MPHGSLTIRRPPFGPDPDPNGADADADAAGAGGGEERGHIWYRRGRCAVPTDRSSGPAPVPAPAPLAAPAPAPVLDRELIERFRSGDREAFLAVHQAHAAAIARRVKGFFPQPFDSEEATQEVWMQVHRVVGTFDPTRGGLLNWLRTVAGNRCLELLRALRRRIHAREDVADHQELSDEEDDPEREMRRARLRAAVDRFKTKLTPREATILQLVLIEEQPLQVVAAAVGASKRHCRYVRKTLIDRALQDPDLRAALEEVVEP